METKKVTIEQWPDAYDWEIVFGSLDEMMSNRMTDKTIYTYTNHETDTRTYQIYLGGSFNKNVFKESGRYAPKLTAQFSITIKGHLTSHQWRPEYAERVIDAQFIIGLDWEGEYYIKKDFAEFITKYGYPVQINGSGKRLKMNYDMETHKRYVVR